MDDQVNKKVNRVMDFLEKDKILTEDPYFITRLEAKTDRYFSTGDLRYRSFPLLMRLRPILITSAMIVAIGAGIYYGNFVSSVKPSSVASERAVRLQQFAQQNFFSEINGSIEEQLLSK